MSVINANPLLAAAGADGYQISRSVRLRSSASAYFNRTLTTPTNNTTWSWSGWVKLGQLGTTRQLFGGAATNYGSFGFESTDQIRFWNNAGTNIASSTAVFRDPSAWYHVVVISNGTTIKAYVNNSEVLSYTGTITNINSAIAHQIGRFGGLSYYTDGYLTEINFIDGQALTQYSFGEFDAVTGVWKPKKYAGTYGTNGFYLNFSDNSAATAAAIGKDSSGNGNNWTPNNISVTAGVTYDSMLDVPTPYADGGNGRGNYAVMNPVNPTANTPSDGNLRAVVSTTENGIASTIAIPSGLNAYWEVVSTNTTSASIGCYVGVASLGVNMAQSASYNKTGVWAMIAVNLRQLYANGAAGSSVASTLANTSILQVAVDNTSSGSNTYIWIGVDNVWYNSTMGTTGNPSTGANPTFTIAKQDLNAFFSGYQNTFNVNFGQRPFTYTPPTGFKALNTQNLPDSTIKKGSQYFDVQTWSGNGVNGRTITSTVDTVDLAWVKKRNGIDDHRIANSVLGGNKHLKSNATDAESTGTTVIQAFSGSTFTVGSDNSVNASGGTYVGWTWKESASAGFDIVTYTGTGANRTVAHSLGAVPKMMIVKSRSIAENWPVYHASMNASPASGRLILDGTASFTASATTWQSTAPTDLVFSVGTATAVNTNGATYVAYLFSEVLGFSKFGSYTGNGAADGPFVYCGFRPKFVITKSSDATAGIGDWTIHDTSRLPYNTNDLRLFANASNAESSSEAMDMLSNGFKIRATNSNCNTSGGGYIYAAFAENPFKNSLAR